MLLKHDRLGALTTCLGSLFQWLNRILLEKCFLMPSLNLLCCNLISQFNYLSMQFNLFTEFSSAIQQSPSKAQLITKQVSLKRQNWALDQESHSHLAAAIQIAHPSQLVSGILTQTRADSAELSQIKASSGAHLSQQKEMKFSVFKLVTWQSKGSENKGIWWGGTQWSLPEVTVHQCSVLRTLVLSVDWM